jgi:GNAT superfamily N-acetyltransferase
VRDKPLEKDLGATPIRVRPATESDAAFIFSSWLKCMRGSNFAKEITSTVFFSEHHRVVERLLKTCQVYVACDENNVDDIYGYGCAEMVDGVFVLHMIYVKHTYRNLGIGTLILNSFKHNSEHAGIYTQHTPVAVRLAAKYRMVYSPYVALTPDYREKVELSRLPKEELKKLEQDQSIGTSNEDK